MSFTFLLIAVVAGALTVLAPCILPLLPVVIGSSAQGRSRWTPFIVIASLGASILIFTYILKVSTLFIDIPNSVWSYFSGGILVLFGLILAWPKLWDYVPGINWQLFYQKVLLSAQFTYSLISPDSQSFFFS